MSTVLFYAHRSVLGINLEVGVEVEVAVEVPLWIACFPWVLGCMCLQLLLTVAPDLRVFLSRLRFHTLFDS